MGQGEAVVKVLSEEGRAVSVCLKKLFQESRILSLWPILKRRNNSLDLGFLGTLVGM